MPVIDVLAWELVANTKGLIAGVGAAQSKLKALSAGAGATVGAVAALGAAMVVAGARAAKMAAELDTALAKVSTLLPETTAELGDLREQIVALSTRVPQTPVQLTEALYQAISAGARDTAEALFLVEQASKAAVAGQSDTETATRAISSVLNAYQLDISEATRVSDVFFKTIEQGVIEFPDIAANIGEISGTAALAGVSIEEVGAAMAAMTKNGISAAEATTALNRFLLAAIKPTDDMAQTAQELGVDLSAAGIEAHGLVGVMRQMEEAAGGDIEKLAELNPNIRAARAAFVIAGKGAEDFRQTLEEMQGSAGSTEEAFGKMLNTAGNLTRIIGNKLNVAFFELGEPILRGLVIPSLQFINALLPELGENSFDFAERIRQINNELGKLERFGLLLKGLFTDDLVRGLNVIGFGGTFEEAFPNLNRALFADQADDLAVGITDDFVRAVEKIPDLVKRRGVLQGAFDEIARQLGEASSDAAGRILEGQLQTIRESLRVLDRQIAARAGDTGREAGRSLGEGVADGIEETSPLILEALKLIEDGFDSLLTDPEADLDAFADTAKINAFRRELERVAGEFDHAGERALAVQGLLDEWELELDDLPPILRTLVSGMTDVGDVSERTREGVRNIVGEIGTAARATTELAEAFGLVGDGAGQVVSQLDLIAQGTKGVIDGLAEGASFGQLLGPIGTAVGGLAGLLGTAFGGGPSQSELERIESQEKNTDQLRRLSEDIDRLREAMFDLPGRLASDVGEFLERGLTDDARAISETDVEGFENFDLFDDEINQLRRSFEAMGVSVTELEEAAGDLEIDQLIRLLEGEDLDAVQQVEAFEQAVALSDKLALSAVDFFDTVTGRLEIAQRRIDRFDIEDPIKQIEEFVNVLEDSDIDLSAAELERLRRGDEDLINELITELETGTGRFAGRAALGDLSRAEAIDILSDIESIGDRIEAPGGRDGVTESFQTFNQITSVQGSALIALTQTGNFFLRQIAENTAALLDGGAQIRPVAAPDIQRIDRTLNGDGRGSSRTASADLLIGEEVDAIRVGNGLPEVRF